MSDKKCSRFLREADYDDDNNNNNNNNKCAFYQIRQFTEELNYLELLAVLNQVLFQEVATAFLIRTVPSMLRTGNEADIGSRYTHRCQ